jgi:cupin 2 domain-containing protein
VDGVKRGNLFTGVPRVAAAELVEALVERSGVRVERVVSTGQATPEDHWYDQA